MSETIIEVNKCIYCDGVGTTDEHIVPLALGGKTKLRNASCERCRNITSAYERNPLSEVWAEARAVLNYPSRRRKFSNEKFQLEVTFKNGTGGVLNLPKQESLGLTPFLEYPLPAFFVENGYKSGVAVSGHRLISFGKDIKELITKYNIKGFKYTAIHKGCDFERMIIRIAYCAAIAHVGLDGFDKRFILPTLLSQKDDAGYWMGSDLLEQIPKPIGKQNATNVINTGFVIKSNDPTRYIISRLKFFAPSDAPEYIVVIGTLKSNFVFPEFKTVEF